MRGEVKRVFALCWAVYTTARWPDLVTSCILSSEKSSCAKVKRASLGRVYDDRHDDPQSTL